MRPSDEASHFVRGVAYAWLTSFLWGFLPIATDMALIGFDAKAIVAFRFTFAFLVLFLFFLCREKPSLSILVKPPLGGVIASLFLALNYYFFVRGVEEGSPSYAAILIQIAPVLVVLFGVFLLKEVFLSHQWLGLVIACLGFYLFSYQKESISGGSNNSEVFVILAAVFWSVFVIMQKQLQKKHSTQSLNLLVYAVAGLIFCFIAEYKTLDGVGVQEYAALLFLGFNTLIAYGSLAEAVKRIPLSLIGVIVATNPLITLVGMKALQSYPPTSNWVRPEVISAEGYLGAGMVIVGVSLVLYRKNKA